MNEFNLPELPKDLSEEEYNYRDKYKRLYIRLIIKCKNMSKEELSGFNEKHHILPRCLGGNNRKENLVLMPVKYHIMAHMILYKIYPDNYKIGHALYCIMSCSNDSLRRKESLEKDFSLRTVTAFREAGLRSIRSKDSRKHRSEIQMGKSNSNYGKHWDQEHRARLSEKSKEAWKRGDFEKIQRQVKPKAWRKLVCQENSGSRRNSL